MTVHVPLTAVVQPLLPTESMISRTSAADPSAKPPGTVWGWFRLYEELGKVRLGSLVVLTAIAGYALGSRGSFRLLDVLSLAVGTLLSAAGANGLNQLIEIKRDRKMHRTESRPLPSGRIGKRHVLALCLIEIVAGLLLLRVGNNTLTAMLSAFVVVTYVTVYTPLKPVSSINTLIGVVCEAIPRQGTATSSSPTTSTSEPPRSPRSTRTAGRSSCFSRRSNRT